MVSMFVFPSFFCFGVTLTLCGGGFEGLKAGFDQNHPQNHIETTFRVHASCTLPSLGGMANPSKDADIHKQVSTTGAKRAVVCCANS